MFFTLGPLYQGQGAVNSLLSSKDVTQRSCKVRQDFRGYCETKHERRAVKPGSLEPACLTLR